MIHPGCPIGLLPRETVTDAQFDEMFSLLSRYFEGVGREQFERDLAEKNWVVEVRRDGQLLGFTTLLVCAEEFEGCPMTAVFSGDTIVVPEAWRSPQLARSWIAAINHLRAAAPTHPCYWLLLTSGFRTYRFLPVFWRMFYPRHDAVIPERERRLLDHLARKKYDAAYDAASGIVRFPNPQRLRGALAEVPDGRLVDADVAFFLARNPGFGRGDELVCMTEICDSNLTAAGRRMIAK